MANAIEHGHRDASSGVINLRATASATEVKLTIADSGSWKRPRPAEESHRGRGMTLMRALMQEVVINPETGGTTVHLTARIV